MPSHKAQAHRTAEHTNQKHDLELAEGDENITHQRTFFPSRPARTSSPLSPNTGWSQYTSNRVTSFSSQRTRGPSGHPASWTFAVTQGSSNPSCSTAQRLPTRLAA